MTTTNVTHRPVVSLKLPRPNSAFITYAQAIVKGMTGNAYFPAPSPTLAVLTAAIADMQTAETAALARTKGAVQSRNEKRATLVSLLQQARSYVQGIADQNPENGGSIITSAGLAVKKAPNRAPRVFEVKAGTVSGQVKLIAPSAGHRSSYEWDYSTDGGKTWVALPPTIQAKTSLLGLTPGTSVQFRYRAVTKTGVADWSAPITMPLVK
jgi:hypothetical protein